MNKKILIIIAVIIVITGGILYYFKKIKPPFKIVSDPVSYMISNEKPDEKITREISTISGEIKWTHKISGTLFFGDTEINVVDSKFQTQISPGMYNVDFVDKENNYYVISPSSIQVFSDGTYNFEILN